MEVEFANHFLSYEGDILNNRFNNFGKVSFKNGNFYEGSLEEGKMNGQGILKWMDGIVYKGDITYNVIGGQGTYTWPDGSSFTGTVIDGKREGYGVWKKGDICYEGEWHLGQKHGKGICYYSKTKQSFYDGDWNQGKKHGWGVMVYESGNRYEGQWKDNIKDGEGQMTWVLEPPPIIEVPTSCNVGSFVLREEDSAAMSQELGQKMRYERYTGSWKAGRPEGYGVYEWLSCPKDFGASGPGAVIDAPYQVDNVYKGMFRNGKKHGLGVCYYADGSVFEGVWVDDKKHGEGLRRYLDGSVDSVLFEMDMLHSVVPVEPAASANGKCTIPPAVPIHDPQLTAGPMVISIDNLPLDFTSYVDTDQEAREVKYLLQRMFTHLRYLYKFYTKLYIPSLPLPEDVAIDQPPAPPIMPPTSLVQLSNSLSVANLPKEEPGSPNKSSDVPSPLITGNVTQPSSPSSSTSACGEPNSDIVPASHCMTLQQFWEMLRDARITTHDFTLAKVNKLILPALQRQIYRKDDDPREAILKASRMGEKPHATSEAIKTRKKQLPLSPEQVDAASMRQNMENPPSDDGVNVTSPKGSEAGSFRKRQMQLAHQGAAKPSKDAANDIPTALKDTEVNIVMPIPEVHSGNATSLAKEVDGNQATFAAKPKPKAARGKVTPKGKLAKTAEFRIEGEDQSPSALPLAKHTPHYHVSRSILANSQKRTVNLHNGTNQILFPTFVECLIRIAHYKYHFTDGHVWASNSKPTGLLLNLQTLFENHISFLTDSIKVLAQANLPGLAPFVSEPLPNITFEAPKSKLVNKKKVRRPGTRGTIGSEGRSVSGVEGPGDLHSPNGPASLQRINTHGAIVRDALHVSDWQGRRPTNFSPSSVVHTSLLPATSRTLLLHTGASFDMGTVRDAGLPISTTSIPLDDPNGAGRPTCTNLDIVEARVAAELQQGQTYRLYAQHVEEGSGMKLTFLGLDLEAKSSFHEPSVRQRMKAKPIVELLQDRSRVLLVTWHTYRCSKKPYCMSLRYFMKCLSDHLLIADDKEAAKHKVQEKSTHIHEAPGVHTSRYPDMTLPPQHRPHISHLMQRLVSELFEEDIMQRILANPEYGDCLPADPIPPAMLGTMPERAHDTAREMLTSAGGTSVDLVSVFSNDFYDEHSPTQSMKLLHDRLRNPTVTDTPLAKEGETGEPSVQRHSSSVTELGDVPELPTKQQIRQAKAIAARLDKMCWAWDYIYGDLEMLYPQFLEAMCIVAEVLFPRPWPKQPEPLTVHSAPPLAVIHSPQVSTASVSPNDASPSKLDFTTTCLEACDIFGLRDRLSALLDWLEHPPVRQRPRTPSPPPLRLPPPLPRKKVVANEPEPVAKGKKGVAAKGVVGKAATVVATKKK